MQIKRYRLFTILNLLKKFSTLVFLAQASLIRRDTLSVIDLSQENRLAKGEKTVLKKRCKIN
jgi:hypothetical protein